MPLPVRRGCTLPDRKGLRRVLVLAVHGKPNRLQLVGNIITHRQPGAITVITDQEDQRNRLAIKAPFAVQELGAHAFHFGVDNFLGLLGVKGIFRFQFSGGIDQVGVFHKLGGDGKKLRQGTTRIDFLVDIVAVDQPVERLTDLVVRERVQTGGIRKDRRVEADTIVTTKGLRGW